jgi:hypothetical protein
MSIISTGVSLHHGNGDLPYLAVIHKGGFCMTGEGWFGPELREGGLLSFSPPHIDEIRIFMVQAVWNDSLMQAVRLGQPDCHVGLSKDKLLAMTKV